MDLNKILGAHRIKFIIYVILTLLSLFMGGVALSYKWEILWVLFFTLLFAFFLVMSAFIYISGQRDSAYETLRRQKEIDEEDARRRMEYFANMSHELRTPINAILGYDELILREYNDPALRQYAYNIRSAGNTLLSLINDSLDYSRIEAGKMELFIAEYDLGMVVEDMVSLIRPRALAKGLDLKGYVNENIPRRLYGDADRLKQCIANLLTNSVKYTDEGEIDFSIDYEAIPRRQNSDTDEIFLKVSIRDTGIGIRDEDLKKLFMPFERIEEDKIKNIEGSGLGLSIVRKILSLMDSDLEVESIYGEGSNFHFSIRQKVADSEPVGDLEQNYVRNVADKSNFKINFTAPDARVLVVDDAELNLSVMEGLLGGTGIQVDSALSAMTGLEMAEKNDYDLIFVDLKMPGLNGGEMIRRLHGEFDKKGEKGKRHNYPGGKSRRNHSSNAENTKADDGRNTKLRNRKTPCIALTAGALQETKSEYKKLGFTDYLLKPIVYTELEMILGRYLPKEKIKKVSDSGRRSKNKDLPLLATEEKLREAYEILANREHLN
ncbi:ATP-binding protein [Butyrivibrio sp. VCD2006]|uniref:ATP-binding protein n=1 Tax=Butyrivibrio sp. VCD2006 TaxID=1280664 RepID=UPI0003FD1DF7|nr:ATP-binding protein [Butyrivibrio sp. VCD2006]